MANYLKVSVMQSIGELCRRGWSQRRIARELGVSRTTVARYVSGAEGESGPGVPTGSVSAKDAESGPRVPAGFERSQSLCLEHAAAIEAARSKSTPPQGRGCTIVFGRRLCETVYDQSTPRGGGVLSAQWCFIRCLIAIFRFS